MTKEEIYEKLDTEVKLRGLSPRTCKTYKNSIGLFLDWADKPYEGLEEIDFRNYLIYLVNRGDLSTSTINISCDFDAISAVLYDPCVIAQ